MCTPASSFPIQELVSSCKEWIVQSESSWHSATWHCFFLLRKVPWLLQGTPETQHKGARIWPSNHNTCSLLKLLNSVPQLQHTIVCPSYLVEAHGDFFHASYPTVCCYQVQLLFVSSLDKGLPKSDPRSAIVPLPTSHCMWCISSFMSLPKVSQSIHPSSGDRTCSL